jgi:predicted GIY-YIG superfamily endonuclease
MSKLISIYALVNPFNDNIFYIGASVNPKSRLSGHINKKKYSYCGCPEWFKIILIEDIIKQGKKPIVVTLKEIQKEDAAYWEEYYYRLFVFYGFELYQFPSYFYV